MRATHGLLPTLELTKRAQRLLLPSGNVLATTMSFLQARTECGEQITSSVQPPCHGLPTARRLSPVPTASRHSGASWRSRSCPPTRNATPTPLEIGVGRFSSHETVAETGPTSTPERRYLP